MIQTSVKLKKIKKIDNTVYTLTNEKKFVLLEARHLRQVELLWLRATQKESFVSELATVKAALPTPRTSRLRNLALGLDARELLRVYTRIAAASEIATEAKSLPVVNGRHPYIRLHVQAVHERLHHAGVETTRNERLFTYVGLDYFGPYNVTIGKQHQKRYVALFTCPTSKAVHLEVAGGLNADSAILANRRMMARRGASVEIWSDNGTNFHGADAEL
ncbi:hypothetical protein EVAR_67190_1 [Eumeta japonica]|uniref:Integrase catalytic domain-containing protein n=1 Tax=Eumeta variegata TaxID=151549 RepID=A0A4C2A354_EUMVA|nr:hypothetical protein EVAR_67190_1 [Eumeta japonica]